MAGIVYSLADWVWGGDDESDTDPTKCLESFPMMNSACWTQLAVKGIGVAIILGACLNKLPVLLNLVNTQSSAGISRNSIYGEGVMYANSTFYGFLLGHPFTAYGESGALLIQTVLIAVVLWQHSTDVSAAEKSTLFGGSALYAVVVGTMLPTKYAYILYVLFLFASRDVVTAIVYHRAMCQDSRYLAKILSFLLLSVFLTISHSITQSFI